MFIQKPYEFSPSIKMLVSKVNLSCFNTNNLRDMQEQNVDGEGIAEK